VDEVGLDDIYELDDVEWIDHDGFDGVDDE